MGRIQVPLELQGMRLDSALAKLWPELSRSAWKRRLSDGQVTLNGVMPKGNEKVRGGDWINWVEEKVISKLPYPVKLDFPVLYEDDDIALIVKPAGLTVHPGHGEPEVTLAHGLMDKFSRLSVLGGEDRPGIVHRLDKETSGLMVVAKTDEAYERLKQAFAERQIYKCYEAVVHNHLRSPMHITDTLGRHPFHRTKMAVVKDGREAVTDVCPLESLGNFTRVKAEILTGRTHQIRVHLSFHGYPIVGDTVYGPKKPGAKELLLAATKLRFVHPKTGEPLNFAAPIPDSMERFIRGQRS